MTSVSNETCVPPQILRLSCYGHTFLTHRRGNQVCLGREAPPRCKEKLKRGNHQDHGAMGLRDRSRSCGMFRARAVSVSAEHFFLPAAFGLGILFLDEARK